MQLYYSGFRVLYGSSETGLCHRSEPFIGVGSLSIADLTRPFRNLPGELVLVDDVATTLLYRSATDRNSSSCGSSALSRPCSSTPVRFAYFTWIVEDERVLRLALGRLDRSSSVSIWASNPAIHSAAATSTCHRRMPFKLGRTERRCATCTQNARRAASSQRASCLGFPRNASRCPCFRSPSPGSNRVHRVAVEPQRPG